MKPNELLKVIAEQAGLGLEGAGKKISAHGTVLGFPVKATASSLMIFGSQLCIDFETAQPVEIEKLNKVLNEHRPKGTKANAFFIRESETKGSALSGVLGGAIGGAIQGAMASKSGNPGGAFALYLTIVGKGSEDALKVQYQQAIVALEACLNQIGVTPPTAAV